MLSLSAKAAGKRPVSSLGTRSLHNSGPTFSTRPSSPPGSNSASTSASSSNSSLKAKLEKAKADQATGRLFNQLLSLHRSHSSDSPSWSSTSPKDSPAASRASALRQSTEAKGLGGWKTTHQKKRGVGVDRQHGNKVGGRRTFSSSVRTGLQSTEPVFKAKARKPKSKQTQHQPQHLSDDRSTLDSLLDQPSASSDPSHSLPPPSVDPDLRHLATPRPWNPSLPEYSKLEPGCYVDVRRNGLPSSGIYLGPTPPTADGLRLTNDHQILSSSGAFTGILPEDVTFILPFADTSLARRANAEGVQSDAARSLWQMQRRFRFAFERRTKDLVERGAKDVYSILGPARASASDNAGRRRESILHSLETLLYGESGASAARTVTTGEALDSLFPRHLFDASFGIPIEFGLMDHLIMHNILMAREDEFVADPVAHRTSGRFTVRPRAELDELEEVRRWVREAGAGSTAGSSPLEVFVKEAVEAIEFGQQQQQTAGGKPGEAATRSPSFVWSPTSLRLLTFLKHTATGSSRMIQSNPYLAITPAILKAVDAKLNPNLELTDGGVLTSTDLTAARAPASTSATTGTTSVDLVAEQDMGKERILAFLAEVGVVAPWEDWVAHESADLRDWDKGQCTKEEVEVSRPKPIKDGVLDAHDAVRHDFGRLAVYTIDDPGALELDDGLSVEPVAGGAAPSYWVHAHIADPTTLIAPNSPMALMAQRRNNTEYFPERTWAMLPHDFILDNKLSLGDAGESGQGQKTVTISARLTEGGEVLEAKVRAGVVNNVKRLTYGAVDSLLGHEKPKALPTLYHLLDPAAASRVSHGSQAPARQTDDATLASDSAALADLTLLHKLATALIARRTKDDALYWHMPRASPTVTGDVKQHYDTPSSPTFYRNQPTISLSLTSSLGGGDIGPAPQSSPAQLLVSELMILANRSAARFAAERGLSLPYVSQPQPDASPAQLEAILALRNPLTGEAKGEDVLKQGIEFSRSEVGLEPKPHWPMGIKDEFGYVRVTSPLRRFGDLLGHWQLKSALLGTASGAKAAFDKTRVGAMIATMNEISKRRGKVDRHANAFWAAYLLRAKHHQLIAPASSASSAPRDELAEEVLTNLTAIALRAPLHSVGDGRWLQQCLIKEVGLMGQIWLPNLASGMGVGESGGVEVVRVLVGGRSRMVVRRKGN